MTYGNLFRTTALAGVLAGISRIAEQSAAAVGKPAVRALRESLSGRQLAIGVDRLD